MFLEISQNSLENTCARVPFLIKRLWRRCLPVNFVKFLKTPFLQNTSGWVLPLFSMMALEVWFEVFSEIMFFVPFQVFFFQVSIFFKKFSKIRMFFTSLKKCRYEIPVFFVVISCFHSYMGVFQLNRFLLDINFWILGVIEGLSLNFSLYFQSFL